ncbi:vWA domain-containing protein [Cellulomonas humilata]|uniref:Uncharacterized protein YegL n=1 Tax=Cellulomonas humilata TaxID=144055 RepID=A0ABU0EL24_9CELL|nr:VWA domain-containing protein [Cellulomonas humilata]MDQ0375986.1 uncharacterized protein YegL [Cellulomonas humilata]
MALAFDPSKFTVAKAKPLPVILLLDVSLSMSGGKIDSLNTAVAEMLASFQGSEGSETEIDVAVITFGGTVELAQPLASARTIQWTGLSTSGNTPMGTALRMAKAMIEDKAVVPSRAYRPTVVLVSDGQPTDDWQQPLDDFVSNGRSSKCDRMALAIGGDANAEVLEKFIAGTDYPLFFAKDAAGLQKYFQFVTMSVTVRTKSQDANVIPGTAAVGIEAPTIDSRVETPASTDDDQGYW